MSEENRIRRGVFERGHVFDVHPLVNYPVRRSFHGALPHGALVTESVRPAEERQRRHPGRHHVRVHDIRIRIANGLERVARAVQRPLKVDDVRRPSAIVPVGVVEGGRSVDGVVVVAPSLSENLRHYVGLG